MPDEYRLNKQYTWVSTHEDEYTFSIWATYDEADDDAPSLNCKVVERTVTNWKDAPLPVQFFPGELIETRDNYSYMNAGVGTRLVCRDPDEYKNWIVRDSGGHLFALSTVELEMQWIHKTEEA